jgi:hypothetical protein
MIAIGFVFAVQTTVPAHAERRVILPGASSENIVDVLLKKKAMIRLCLKNGHCGSMTVYMPSPNSLNYDYQYDGQPKNSISLNFPGVNIIEEEDSAKVEATQSDNDTILLVTNGSYRATLTKINANKCKYLAPIIKKAECHFE